MLDWLQRGLSDPEVDVGGRLVPLAIRRHARARRLTMRVAADGSAVCITMPTWCGTRDALAFAEARRSWIGEQLARVPAAMPVQPDARIPYRGGECRIVWQKESARRPALDGEAIILGGPRESIARRLQRWLEGEALRLCGEDLALYCARAGVAPPALRLSRARRRWGSCSHGRAEGRCIRINWRLVMAPDMVRRSVVAHEVAHLTHFDHSPAFHAHLARIYDDDLPRADAWLRREGRALYTHFA